MGAIGMVEAAVGVAVFSSWTKKAACLAAAWLGVIAINLATNGTHSDVAVREVAIAAGAYALAQLTAERKTSKVRSHELPDPAEVLLIHL